MAYLYFFSVENHHIQRLFVQLSGKGRGECCCPELKKGLFFKLERTTWMEKPVGHLFAGYEQSSLAKDPGIRKLKCWFAVGLLLLYRWANDGAPLHCLWKRISGDAGLALGHAFYCCSSRSASSSSLRKSSQVMTLEEWLSPVKSDGKEDQRNGEHLFSSLITSRQRNHPQWGKDGRRCPRKGTPPPHQRNGPINLVSYTLIGFKRVAK